MPLFTVKNKRERLYIAWYSCFLSDAHVFRVNSQPFSDRGSLCYVNVCFTDIFIYVFVVMKSAYYYFARKYALFYGKYPNFSIKSRL